VLAARRPTERVNAALVLACKIKYLKRSYDETELHIDRDICVRRVEKTHMKVTRPLALPTLSRKLFDLCSVLCVELNDVRRRVDSDKGVAVRREANRIRVTLKKEEGQN
jgi:hypothetical protein